HPLPPTERDVRIQRGTPACPIARTITSYVGRDSVALQCSHRHLCGPDYGQWRCSALPGPVSSCAARLPERPASTFETSRKTLLGQGAQAGKRTRFAPDQSRRRGRESRGFVAPTHWQAIGSVLFSGPQDGWAWVGGGGRPVVPSAAKVCGSVPEVP